MNIKIYEHGVWLDEQGRLEENPEKLDMSQSEREDAWKKTMAYSILQKHNVSGDEKKLGIKFDMIASHDITYVSIIQTARASGMETFPLPFVLTNCHNSLCAVGGTINEDDHAYGYSAARKYGGIFVPANLAVIHQYMREMEAGCGKMILSTDSHTRYGALGTIAMGEGGGELVKQLLGATYDISYPKTLCIRLTGKPVPGVGPQDIALTIVGATYQRELAKNKILEFVGPGVHNLSAEYRIGIDVMMTEAASLSTIWETDEEIEKYLRIHGREKEYQKIQPQKHAYYDTALEIDLSRIRSMIAMPFHPSNVYEVEQFIQDPGDILRTVELEIVQKTGDQRFRLTDKLVNGKFRTDQGIIAGCAGGTYTNIMEAANIFNCAKGVLNQYSFSIYPSSQPVLADLMRKGTLQELIAQGVVLKPCFCGPCFGVGDTPQNHGFSIRHVTRNFVTREGSKPEFGQSAAVAIMDARTIAATAANGGFLTPATEYADDYEVPEHFFDSTSYQQRVYHGWGHAMPQETLVYGPNITDWPEFASLKQHVLINVCAKFDDAITTTDDLLPSGEASAYRSNPQYLATFALSRRKPDYVVKSEQIKKEGETYTSAGSSEELRKILAQIRSEQLCSEETLTSISVGSCIVGHIVGDGSAREQAVSSQKILGGLANISEDYATKRYCSNLINWGILPFRAKNTDGIQEDDWIFVPDIQKAMDAKNKTLEAWIVRNSGCEKLELELIPLDQKTRDIIKAGCLINYYKEL